MLLDYFICTFFLIGIFLKPVFKLKRLSCFKLLKLKVTALYIMTLMLML